MGSIEVAGKPRARRASVHYEIGGDTNMSSLGMKETIEAQDGERWQGPNKNKKYVTSNDFL